MNILTITQIVSSVLLVVLIMLQQRGTGMSGGMLGMGGGGGDGGSYSSRRGVEKYLFVGTIILAVMFLGSAFLQLIL